MEDLKDISNRILKDSKLVDPKLYNWDYTTRTFSSNEDGLVLDFECVGDCTFTTGNDCTFDTGCDCVFTTGNDCTFDTGCDCVFNTWNSCTFTTGNDCTFDTCCDCTFNTWNSCTFNTGNDCTFNTWNSCTFTTGCDCTFTTGYSCIIINRNYNNKIIITQPIPNQKLFIDSKYNVIYDNPIVDIKYRKDNERN